MDPFDPMNPNVYEPRFMDLLTSQQLSQTLGTNPFDDEEPGFSTQYSENPSLDEHTPKERRERRKWSPTEDVVLISAWLNTSKDAVVGNEQKGNAFWSRITSYYHASPKLAGLQKREPSHCKQRWGKINDQVCKFVGCLNAATTQKSSGQNEDNVMKLALAIYFNDYKKPFTLEHAWRELCLDQKWCSTTGAGMSKRRKMDDGSAHSSSSQVSHGEEASPARPPGVKAAKAAKAKAKRAVRKPTTAEEEEGKDLKEFQSIWEIKEKDYALNQKQSKLTMLENLIGKTGPLSDIEMTLKNKLINDMLSNE